LHFIAEVLDKNSTNPACNKGLHNPLEYSTRKGAHPRHRFKQGGNGGCHGWPNRGYPEDGQQLFG
jgi:hypothetical protein